MKKSMNKFLNKKLIINLIIIGVFAIISLVYFYPLLSGKQIKQSDIDQFSGMSKQIVDHREKYDEECLSHSFFTCFVSQLTEKEQMKRRKENEKNNMI